MQDAHALMAHLILDDNVHKCVHSLRTSVIRRKKMPKKNRLLEHEQIERKRNEQHEEKVN